MCHASVFLSSSFFSFFSYLKLFWFGQRGDCSQMLIQGGLQTAISLISCERGNVRCSLGAGPGRVNTCDPARLVTHSEKKGKPFLIVPPVEGRIQGWRSSPSPARVQWSGDAVCVNKKWLNEHWPCSPPRRHLFINLLFLRGWQCLLKGLARLISSDSCPHVSKKGCSTLKT